MGKSLKGRECGKGIYQRPDKLYSARYTDRMGNRQEKYFKTLPEARNWLETARYQDRHTDIFVPSETTVDQWFDYWIENIVGDLAPNTLRNYRERYIHNIQPVIGKMAISDVKQMHCKKILIQMDANYAGSTIRQAYITMGTLFKAAKMNDLICKHPMDGVRYTKPVRAKNDINFFTREEQRIFLEKVKRSHNYSQYVLILETGLRTGEMIALTWDSIDFEKRTLTVNKTMEFRYGTQTWRAGPPKTAQSYRTIPLTDRAFNILWDLWEKKDFRKESPMLSQTLEYIDRRTGTTAKLEMKNLVFINFRTGEPAKNSSYDTHLYRLCEEASIHRIGMHALRHTYATRAIESGMQPNILQKLLGHASIKTTMDRYVHVTNESMEEAIKTFETNRVEEGSNMQLHAELA